MKQALSGLIISLLILIFYTSITPQAQPLAPCGTRPTYRFDPRVWGIFWCLELVNDAPISDEPGYTALTFSPEGTLYATRPLEGLIIALTDEDGDGLQETPRTLITDLTYPNALTWYNDALYIADVKHIYRWQDDTLTPLATLPDAGGFWPGGLVISPDERLIVSIGAPCDLCEFNNPTQGAILSFNLNGEDQQIIAQGLRHPAGLAYWQGDLYTTDSAPRNSEARWLDEINRVTQGAHFGFPYCIGKTNTPLLTGDFDCTQATPPRYALETFSNPSDLVVYAGEAFPRLNGQLIAVLSGSTAIAEVRGYEIITFDVQADGTTIIETIAPVDNVIAPTVPVIYAEETGYVKEAVQYINARYGGFFPHRPYKIAISPEGWIYFSRGGGQIFALRPGNFIIDDAYERWHNPHRPFAPEEFRYPSEP